MTAANRSSLVTLGDFLQFAVRSFRRARLAYGHGTNNARDEAAFLLLEALRLPIHDIAPWLELRPTKAEDGHFQSIGPGSASVFRPLFARCGVHARRLAGRPARPDTAFFHRRHAQGSPPTPGAARA